jgi:hypothetical protein
VRSEGSRVTLRMRTADGVINFQNLQPFLPVAFLFILTVSSISMLSSLGIVSESDFVHEFS